MVRHLVFGSFVAMLVSATPAAAAQRTFVRSDGVDSNPCTPQQPCRGFAAAIALTDPDGEIVVLDSAGYGSVTVTKAVSIIAPPGVYAGISVFAAQDGVTVNAGASDKVALRGLTINGQGGNRGIVVVAAGEVHIEQCAVTNMALHGIEIDGGTRIHVRSSVVRSNGHHGLFIAAGSPEANLVDSQVSRNGQNGIHVAVGTLNATRSAVDDNAQDGVRVEGTIASVTATLTDSTFTGNGGDGAVAAPAFLQTVAMAIARSTSARNGKNGFVVLSVFGTALLTVSGSAALENAESGLLANGTQATAIVAGSTLAGNALADLAQTSSAVLRSSQNNALTGRGAADIAGTLTPNPLQ